MGDGGINHRWTQINTDDEKERREFHEFPRTESRLNNEETKQPRGEDLATDFTEFDF
jgi:hypothetical protein